MLTRILKAIYFWPTAYIITVFFALLTGVRHYQVLLTRGPRDGRKEHEVAILWGKSMMAFMPGWTVSVTGRENLPGKDGSFVIVSNHESLADITALYYLGIQFRWLSKAEVFKVPLVGWAMRNVGYISIERGNRGSHIKAMSEAVNRIENRIPMYFFPEGTRSKDGKVKPFKLGAFRLAMKCGVPVLPIVITGTSKLLQKGSIYPGKAHVKIKVLPLMECLPDEDATVFAERVRQEIIVGRESLV